MARRRTRSPRRTKKNKNHKKTKKTKINISRERISKKSIKKKKKSTKKSPLRRRKRDNAGMFKREVPAPKEIECFKLDESDFEMNKWKTYSRVEFTRNEYDRQTDKHTYYSNKEPEYLGHFLRAEESGAGRWGEPLFKYIFLNPKTKEENIVYPGEETCFITHVHLRHDNIANASSSDDEYRDPHEYIAAATPADDDSDL